jgi:hypothetical protein
MKVKVTDGRSVGRSVSLSWCRAPLEGHDQISVMERTVTVLPLLVVLSDENMGLSLVSCHSNTVY